MMLCVFRVRGARRRAFRVGVQGTRGGEGGGGRERVRPGSLLGSYGFIGLRVPQMPTASLIIFLNSFCDLGPV